MVYKYMIAHEKSNVSPEMEMLWMKLWLASCTSTKSVNLLWIFVHVQPYLYGFKNELRNLMSRKLHSKTEIID